MTLNEVVREYLAGAIDYLQFGMKSAEYVDGPEERLWNHVESARSAYDNGYLPDECCFRRELLDVLVHHQQPRLQSLSTSNVANVADITIYERLAERQTGKTT